MFGYIRIFKPHLRICEYDTYKSIYCGLCKTLGKSYGIISRFTLSYDFTFLAMLETALKNNEISVKNEPCIAHPFKKTLCAYCDGGFEFTASAAVLTLYHKLCDDKIDKGIKKKIRARFLLPFIKKEYKKAAHQYPELASTIEYEMENQFIIEKEKCSSIDMAGEPTANIMKAIAGEISDNPEQKRILERFGYLLGRYIFFCDAIKDLDDDFKDGNYNVLLLQKNIIKLDKEEKDYLKEIATDTINFTLGELANTYLLLDIQKYKPIFDNIIYLGLKNTISLILQGKSEKEKKNERSV